MSANEKVATAIQATENNVEMNKIAEDLYFQGRLIGAGMYDELMEKEAMNLKSVENAAKSGYNAVREGLSSGASKTKKILSSAGKELDNAAKSTGQKIMAGASKVMGSAGTAATKAGLRTSNSKVRDKLFGEGEKLWNASGKAVRASDRVNKVIGGSALTAGALGVGGTGAYAVHKLTDNK